MRREEGEKNWREGKGQREVKEEEKGSEGMEGKRSEWKEEERRREGTRSTGKGREGKKKENGREEQCVPQCLSQCSQHYLSRHFEAFDERELTLLFDQQTFQIRKKQFGNYSSKTKQMGK